MCKCFQRLVLNESTKLRDLFGLCRTRVLNVGGGRLNHLIFADDVAIFADTKEDLKTMLLELESASKLD